MPAAFAAVVRKLMSKNPDERYQNAAELRADLVRWTDPARVRAILGAEADAARSFRPPPPELAEDDLRLLDGESTVSRDQISLRELGGAEPSLAPRHQSPAPPMPAFVRGKDSPDSIQRSPHQSADSDTRWLVHFAIIAAGAWPDRDRFYRPLFPFLSPIGARRALAGAVFTNSRFKCFDWDGFFMIKVDSGTPVATCDNIRAEFPGDAHVPAVVEVGLLMPAHWAAA